MIHIHLIECVVDLMYTVSGKKNGTNNILGITLTKFNKFSQFLAQFMLTHQLTKKYYKKYHHYLYSTT